jgi:hypothetical protein
MNKKDAILPENKALHVILGSHCTHNNNDAWLNKIWQASALPLYAHSCKQAESDGGLNLI